MPRTPLRRRLIALALFSMGVSMIALPTTTPLALLHAQDHGAGGLSGGTPAAEPASESSEEEALFGVDLPLYDPSGVALRPLHRALQRAESGDGQARLLFYGASHVAGDYFTHVIRQNLQERFGNAGHGFILPARPWRHYRHLGGVSVESNRRRWDALRIRASSHDVDYFGLAGVAVEASSPEAFGRIDTGSQPTSRFEVYFLRQPDGGSFDITLDGVRRARIRTASEEVEAGYAIVNASDAPHVLEVHPRGDGNVRLFGVALEREVPGVIVDTLGINGARAASHLLWDEDLYREHLRRRHPDLVALAYGTNESGDDDQPIERYEARLRSVVARVRATVPYAACLLIGPSDRPERVNGAYVDRPRTAQIVDVQRRVSRDFGCAFFDLVAFGGGPLSMVRWAAAEPPFAQRDHVHFTARGYRRLGEVLHHALMDRFDRVHPVVGSGSAAAPGNPAVSGAR